MKYCPAGGVVSLAFLALGAVSAFSAAFDTSIFIIYTPSSGQLELSWNAVSNATYRLQHRTTFAPEAPWKTIDVFRPTGSTFRATVDGDPLKEESHFREVSGFYRLILPQPEIFRVEPARFALGGPVEFYVAGQCFGPETELRANQLTISDLQIVHSGLMRGSVVPQVAGTYVFELVHNGTVTSSFQVECFDPVAPPPTVLQEPPEEPWASPMRTHAQPGNPATKAGSNTRSPRVTPAGEVELDEVDLFIPGRGLDFIWGRRYRSRSGPNTLLGNRWDFSYNINARQVANGIEVRDGMGRADVFAQAADGTFVRDEHFSVGTITGNVFRLTFADTGFWEFLPFDGSGTAGKLSRIVDRNGNTMRLEYDGAFRLARIIDTLNRTNTIQYIVGKIFSVTDFTGRGVIYTYYNANDLNGASGDLKSVISPAVTNTPNGNDFPNGKTTTYTYTRGSTEPRENSLLLSIVDPNNQTAYRQTYERNAADPRYLRCISRQVGNANEVLTYNYLPQAPSPSNQFAALKMIVNDRVGNVCERSFDARHRLLLQRDFTGRAIPGIHVSDTTNRPANKLRATDPDFFETRYEWNNDSLCTRVVHPRGNETQRLYEREFDPAARARKKGDLRLLRETTCCPLADVDRDGLADLPARTWHLEYDPWFGSPASRKSTNNTILPAINPGPKRTSDPLGNVTTTELDIRGNRIRHIGPFIVGNDPPVTDYTYNAFGQLTGVTNAPDGQGRRRVDTFTYHTSGPQAGYLASVRRDNGGLNLVTSCEYDARGNLTRRVDPRGSDELFIYNVLDHVVRLQSRPHLFGTGLRVATDYFYDGNDNLVRVDHENRNEAGTLEQANPHWTTVYQYDVLDRRTLVVQEVTQNSSLSNRFRYNANGNLIRVELPEAVSGADSNNIVMHAYDERNLPLESVAAPGTGLGAITRVDYNANGHPVRVTASGAQATRESLYTYDGLDRLAQVTDAMGNERLFTRDANDNLLRERLLGELDDMPGSANNRRLSEMRYEYDALDRLTRVRESFFDTASGQDIGDGEATSTFTYAPNGLQLSGTDDNGRTTRYAYDTANRLASVTDPGSNVVSVTYDANGNVLTRKQTDRSDLGGPTQVFTATFAYDDLDRPYRVTDNVGNSEFRSFDSRDNLSRQTDPRQNDTVYEYDGVNRLIRTTHFTGQAAGGMTVRSSGVEYRNNRLVSSTDGNSNTTFYAHDSLDRRTMITNPDGTTHVFVWNAFANVSTEQDANGTVVLHTFDALDRCVRKDITPAQGVAATTTFEEFSYDGASRMVRGGNDGNVHTFIWDSRSNARQQSQTVGGATLVSTGTFDGVGNRLSLTHPSGRVVSSTFDALDRPATVSLAMGGPATQLAAFAYDGPDRLARINRANGIDTLVQWNGIQNRPNGPGDFGWQQVAGLAHQVSGGGASIDTRVLAYDRAQNKTLRAQTVPFTVGGLLRSNVWSHDALDRLSSSDFFVGNDPPSTRDYQVDANGNRQVVIDDGQSMPYQMNNILPEPGDFQMNQYTASPFGAHQYDRNGNLVATIVGNRRTLYQYDYAHRLVSVQSRVGTGLTPVADYAYDALGRRVSKTIHLPTPMAPVTTIYFRDQAGGIVEERVGGSLTRSYVVPEIGDEVLAAVTAAGQAQYYVFDDLGNVLALTDAAGNVLERYDYDDYGMPQFLDASGNPMLVPPGVPATESPAGNPFLFHGMFWDSETALYDARFDPATGRYIVRSRAVDDGKNLNWNFSGRSFAGENPWTWGSCWDIHESYYKARGNGVSFGYILWTTPYVRGSGPIKNGFIRLNTQKASGGGGFNFAYIYWTSPGPRAEGIDYNSSPSNKSNAIAPPPGGGGFHFGYIYWTTPGSRAEGIDYNSSQSNKSNAIASPDGGGGGGSGTRAEGIDYNSSRSNKSNAIAPPPGGGGFHFGYIYWTTPGSRAEGIDYNSSRSNKSNAIASPDGGVGSGSQGGVIGILRSKGIGTTIPAGEVNDCFPNVY